MLILHYPSYWIWDIGGNRKQEMNYKFHRIILFLLSVISLWLVQLLPYPINIQIFASLGGGGRKKEGGQAQRVQAVFFFHHTYIKTQQAPCHPYFMSTSWVDFWKLGIFSCFSIFLPLPSKYYSFSLHTA